jgi:hypothetical protein
MIGDVEVEGSVETVELEAHHLLRVLTICPSAPLTWEYRCKICLCLLLLTPPK